MLRFFFCIKNHLRQRRRQLFTSYTGLSGCSGEAPRSPPRDWVEVREDDHRAGQLRRHLLQHRHHGVRCHAGRERPRSGCLDDGAVGVGVGERHADLYDVGTEGVEDPERLRRRGQVGISGGDVRDERRLCAVKKLKYRSVHALHRGAKIK